MRANVLSLLLRMRYKLMWAQVRLRNGKIILFVAGYLLAALILMLLGLGGIGAGFAAIRTGQAEFVARIVLGGFFGYAMLTSVLQGFGMNKIFAADALRRLPLTAMERLTARQFIGVLEPLWLFAAALYLGVAFGFSAVGVTALWLAVPAALLLVAANYLLARLVLEVVDRLLAARSGALILVILLWSAAFAPSILGRSFFRNPSLREAAFTVLQFTPPFSAAAVMAGTDALLQIAKLIAWVAMLTAGLFSLERFPVPTRTVAGGEAAWNTFYDRVATLFPGVWAPLVGKTLRYYLRNPRVRLGLMMTLPMLGFIVLGRTRLANTADPQIIFVHALFASCILGVLVTSYLDVNLFGYEGSGFRRYLLAPVPPIVVLRIVNVTSLLIGAALIPIGLVAWTILSPYPADWRMLVMLMSSALFGLFFFRALALWASLLAPRRADYYQTFGYNISVGGRIVVMSSVVVGLMIPSVFQKMNFSAVLLAYWWVAPLLVPLAAALFFGSVQAGAVFFTARRERLLAVMEGHT